MNEHVKNQAKEFLWMTLGTALVAVGIHFFKFPNHFSTGGVSGLAVLLGPLTPDISPATYNGVINLLFLVLGFLVLDKGFGFKTVYCSVLYSVLVQAMEWIYPLSAPMTDQKMLELFFAVILPAIGSAILFNINASTGGTDIVAMILKKFSGMDVGRALLLSDVVIAGSTLFIFGIETGLYSLLGLVLKSVLVDTVIESLNRRKSFMVVTEQPHAACAFITHELGRGATVWEGKGAYTGTPHWVVLTALSRGQAVLLRRHLKETDPHAFVIIANSSEIFGKGFLRA